MPKGERNIKPPMVGVFFEGTREQFGAVAEIAALVNEAGVTVERVKRALAALKAVEEALGGATPVAAAPKKRATKKTVAKMAAKKKAAKKPATKQKAGWSDERRARFAKTVAAKKKVAKLKKATESPAT